MRYMKAFIEKEIEAYLSYLEKVRGYSSATITTYRIALRQMLELAGFVQDEGQRIIDLYPLRLEIAAQNKKTIAKKLSAIRSFVDYLEENDQPVKLKGDSSVKIPKTLPKPVSDEHIREALATTDLEDRLIIMMLYGLGLRISELAALELDSITSGWVRVLGKGGKMREIPIPEALSKLIVTYREQHKPVRYLLENKSQRFSENSLRYRLNKLFKTIGVKATPHQLRHAYATELLNNGARILDVKELLGHSSLQTTEIYTKLSSSLKLNHYLNAHPLCQDEEQNSSHNGKKDDDADR